jgi:hypothetical protein
VLQAVIAASQSECLRGPFLKARFAEPASLDDVRLRFPVEFRASNKTILNAACLEST